MAVVSFILNCVSKCIGFVRNWWNDEKNRKEKRMAEVLNWHVRNEMSGKMKGKSSMVNAGAASLPNDEEIDEVISRAVARGLKNPVGEDYIKIKERRGLLRFFKIASNNVHRKTREVTLSSEQIIEIMDKEDGNI